MKIPRVLLPLTATILLVAVMDGALAQSVPGTWEKETVVRSISMWDGGCSGKSLSSWDDMLRGWYNEIRNNFPPPFGHGSRAWVGDGFYHNGNIVDSDFIDPDRATWGRDNWNDRPDDDDVFFAGLHGGHNNSVQNWLGTVRVDEPGGGNCWANQYYMELGDKDLEFLHLSSCHSMCQQNWTDWWNSFAGLHQALGFYGLMYIHSSYTSHYRDFADDSFYMGMAVAWVDNHYVINAYQGGDQCPVSMIAGTGASNVVHRACYEQYDWVYSDPNNPHYWWIMFVRGCDPKPDDDVPSLHGPLNP